MMRTFIIPTIIIGVFILGAIILVATAPILVPAAQTPILTTVRILEVNPQSLQLKVHSQGSVIPATETQLIPEISGRIDWMSAKLVAGGYYAKNEVLARINDADYRDAEDRAKAGLQRAKAEQQLSSFQYQRLVSLAEGKLASQSQLENSLRAHRVANAALRDAEVSIKQVQQNLERTNIRAPFTGFVRSKNVDIGQFVSTSAAIATLYASDLVEVRLPIADRQLAFLQLPATVRGELPEEQQPSVTLTADYAGQKLSWQGKVVRTEAEIDIASRMLLLVARIAGSEKLRPPTVGLFVEAEIEGLSVQNIVVLPRSALRNNNRVLIVDDQDRLRFRSIQQLRLYQDDVLVKGGLNLGDRVVLSPLQTAIDGMKVNPVIEDDS
jgi:RND family efflux transporter MFP subunit